jgi:hypothetical protein
MEKVRWLCLDEVLEGFIEHLMYSTKVLEYSWSGTLLTEFRRMCIMRS